MLKVSCSLGSNRFAKLIVILGILSLSSASFSKPLGLSDEGCQGWKQELAIAEISAKVPGDLMPFQIGGCKGPPRCDGGFPWEPYLMNRERAWLVVSSPSTRSSWVKFGVYNLCSKRRIVSGGFLNTESSPYIRNQSAVVPIFFRDPKQSFMRRHGKVYFHLYRSHGDAWIDIYGVEQKTGGINRLDSFLLEKLP